MKFKEYVEHLSNLLKEHPESAEYDVIYSVDVEGNFFETVHFQACLCEYLPDDKDIVTGVAANVNAVVIN